MKAIRAIVAKRAYAGRHSPIISTATGGSTTTVVDSAYAIPGATTDHFDFKIIKIATDAGGAAADPEGDVRYISEGGYTVASGTFTVPVAFTAAVASGDTYEVHEIHPDEIDNIIKAKVRNIYAPTFFPLSMHIVQNDANDMEPSSIATDYDVTGGAALATESTIVHNGAQSLQATCNVALEYFSLKAVIGVNAGQQLYAGASCYVTSGDDAIFRAWDTTNAAAIDSATSDEPSWIDLVIPVNIPSGCEQLDLRGIGVGSNDVTYWDDIQVWRQGTGVYPLPSWITRMDQVVDVRAFRLGTGGPSNDFDYRTNEERSYSLSWGFEREDLRADRPLHIWVEGAGQDRPYIIARRNLTEPTSDTSNIFFDPEIIAEGVLAEVFDILAGRSTGEEKQRLEREARESRRKWVNTLEELLPPVVRDKPGRVWV